MMLKLTAVGLEGLGGATWSLHLDYAGMDGGPHLPQIGRDFHAVVLQARQSKVRVEASIG